MPSKTLFTFQVCRQPMLPTLGLALNDLVTVDPGGMYPINLVRPLPTSARIIGALVEDGLLTMLGEKSAEELAMLEQFLHPGRASASPSTAPGAPLTLVPKRWPR